MILSSTLSGMERHPAERQRSLVPETPSLPPPFSLFLVHFLLQDQESPLSSKPFQKKNLQQASFFSATGRRKPVASATSVPEVNPGLPHPSSQVNAGEKSRAASFLCTTRITVFVSILVLSQSIFSGMFTRTILPRRP